MELSALPFVNWIFWAGLSAGTLLVVGLTELLGGTTPSYRLFMAWMLVVFAAILVASDLALPLGVEAAATADLRRPLTLAFAAGCVAYLVASLARWPRSWLAIGTGIVGLAALVVLATAGGSRSARSSPASSCWLRLPSARSTRPCCSATGTSSRRSCRRHRCDA